MGGEGGGWKGGVVGGGCCLGALRRRPETVLACPPTCPFHPTFLSRCAPSTDLAVTEIAEHNVLFFVRNVHQIEISKGSPVDAESEMHFAMLSVAPPLRPSTMWHLLNTAPVWWLPKCSKARAWSITRPCDCKKCLLVCLLP